MGFGGGSSGSTTIGYRYYFSILMGIGRQSLDQIVEIRVGDKMAWPIPSGTAPPNGPHPADQSADGEGGGKVIGPDGVVIGGWSSPVFNNGGYVPIKGNVETSINAGDLFGGDKREGGIQGRLSVMMGGPTQKVSSWIKRIIGGTLPEFRGVTTVFFDGLVCALNPYPKVWKFRVRRALSGWDGGVWEPQLAVITYKQGAIRAMNPAHILYEAATNREWGRGLPRSMIGPSFKVCAQKLYDENFGLCLRYNRQDDLSTFVAQVIDHIAGSIYTSRETGLLEMLLVRDDYDPDELPHFDYDSGLLEVEAPEVGSREDLGNEVVVKWRDPITNMDRSVSAHNLAAIQNFDKVKNSNTVEYNGVPYGPLAQQLAARDLKVGTLSNRRYTVKLDRSAWRLVPGSVFKITAPDKNIFNLVLRAGKVDQDTIEKGDIDIIALPDIFGLPAANFSVTEDIGWQPPDRRPVASRRIAVREASYRDIFILSTRAELAQILDTEAYVCSMAAKPTSLSLSYDMLSKTSVETDYVKRNSPSFAPSGKLKSAITSTQTIITLYDLTDFDLIKTPCALDIDGETLRVDSIDFNEATNEAALTVARGCVDSAPTAHKLDDAAFFFDRYLGLDRREYAPGEIVDVKFSTSTTGGTLALAASPRGRVTLKGRQGKPYPAADVRINGASVYTTIPSQATVIVDWSHRNRQLQQDQLLGYFEPSIDRETGVTYTIKVYVEDVLKRTVTGITTKTWTYTAAMQVNDGSLTGGKLAISLETVRGTYISDTSTYKSFFRN